jgi:hypothetical protein
MRSNPRFKIGELVQASKESSRLQGRGKVRDIAIELRLTEPNRWVYTVEPEEPGDFIDGLPEADLAPVETPADRRRQREERIVHHAEEARQWAKAADDAASEPDPEDGGRERAGCYAAVSQAHGLASIASVLAESSIGIEQ